MMQQSPVWKPAAADMEQEGDGNMMMEMEEFAQAVLAGVNEKSEGSFCAEITKRIKNNGFRQTGILAATQGSNAGPVIYLDACYERYRKGYMGTGEAAGYVYEKIVECMEDLDGIRLPAFQEWESVKGNIHAGLVNAGMNREMLMEMPHRPFLDLAMVYYIKIDGLSDRDSGMSFVQVSNNYMELWGKDEGSLYRTAMENMRLEGKPLIEDMEALLRDMMPEETGGELPEIEKGMTSGVYVLSNQCRHFGAAELLDSDTLEEIGRRLEDDYVVLPSSVHECIILPLNTAPSYEELAGMVRAVNREQVDIQDRLSDHVYQYDREEGKLEIVA